MKRIGIDLDKTMFTFSSLLYGVLNALQFIRSDKKVKFKEIDIDKTKSVNPIIKKLHKAFNPAYYKPFPLAIETINELHDAGYEIYFISNRPNISPIVRATCAWLKNNNVHCDKLILGCNNKSEFALQNGIDVMIDDLKVNCKKSEEKGVKSILFRGKLKNNGESVRLSKKRPKFTVLSSWRNIGQYINGLFDMTGDKIVDGEINDFAEEMEELVS